MQQHLSSGYCWKTGSLCRKVTLLIKKLNCLKTFFPVLRSKSQTAETDHVLQDSPIAQKCSDCNNTLEHTGLTESLTFNHFNHIKLCFS